MERCSFLEDFLFCPKCAGEFASNNSKSKRCVKCGFVYYFNPSAAVAAFIKNPEGEILVATRANNPAKGSFDLPGGFVDCYESGEQAIRREIREECGVEVLGVKYLFSQPNIYNYSGLDVHTLDLFFECEVADFKALRAEDDVASLQFIPVDKIDVELFGLLSVREGVRQYLKGASDNSPKYFSATIHPFCF